MADIEQSIHEHKPDIIALTEVKPKICTVPLQESEITLDGYHPPVHNLGQDGRRICVYVSTQLGVEVFNIDNADGKEFEESVWVKVKVGSNKAILFGCVYRSPSSTSDNNRDLENLLRCVSDINFQDLIVVGDFNYPGIDWDTCVTSDREDSNSDRFTECINDCFWFQHVDQPTRYRGDQRPSILDLVFTNQENVVKDLSYNAPFGNSDHCVLVFDYVCKAEIANTRTKKYKFDKGGYEAIRDHLAGVNWEEEFENRNTQEAWDCLVYTWNRRWTSTFLHTQYVRTAKGRDNLIWTGKE